jgi:hypothetical protein
MWGGRRCIYPSVGGQWQFIAQCPLSRPQCAVVDGRFFFKIIVLLMSPDLQRIVRLMRYLTPRVVSPPRPFLVVASLW